MIPPPNLGSQPYDPEAPPLEVNEFRVDGTSVGYLRSFCVFDDETNDQCRVAVTSELEQVVAAQWAYAESPPPGAVQQEGEVRVRFAPAVPGRVYRMQCSGGTQRARYEGDRVERGAIAAASGAASVADDSAVSVISPSSASSAGRGRLAVVVAVVVVVGLVGALGLYLGLR